jgi:hypothetical protein
LSGRWVQWDLWTTAGVGVGMSLIVSGFVWYRLPEHERAAWRGEKPAE